jgi:hypothetical protein
MVEIPFVPEVEQSSTPEKTYGNLRYPTSHGALPQSRTAEFNRPQLGDFLLKIGNR